MKRTMKTAVSGAVLLAALGVGSQVYASDWTLRVGDHYIEPKSNNHPLVNVGSAQNLTFDITYHYTPYWGFELLAALPFQHDIDLNAGGAKVAQVKQLPPTLSVQYSFLPFNKVRPYVGAGLNATLFFSEKTTGALAGTNLSLSNSYGPAAQLGVDVDVGKSMFMNLDARWISIGTDAHLNGASLGTVHVDPLTVGLSVGYRFGRD